VSQNQLSSPKKLNPKEAIYTQSRLAGLSQIASASAAGCNNPQRDGYNMEQKPHVQAAIAAALTELAEEVGFTRKEAHEMLMSAFQNAATAAEQIQAVKEMIALHGLAAPKKLEVKHNHDHSGTISLERMETGDLMKLANLDQSLTLEGEFKEVKDDRKSLPKV
jgi:hypothetical protein